METSQKKSSSGLLSRSSDSAAGAEEETAEEVDGTILHRHFMELMLWVRALIKRHPSLQKISFVGHSLGGLITRYVVACLYEQESPQNSEKSKERIGGLEPVCFITSATPHLGSRGHKQVPLMAGVMTDELRSFLELNLPKVKEGKKPKFSLETSAPKLGSHILEATKIPCQINEFVLELLCGMRLHFDRFIKDLKVSLIEGRVGVHHLDDSQQNKNFTFKCQQRWE
ncbi:unnamed protein product [Brassica oleracea]